MPCASDVHVQLRLLSVMFTESDEYSSSKVNKYYYDKEWEVVRDNAWLSLLHMIYLCLLNV